ncbi:hypothetical protein HYU96_03080 [Candidatus Daviesbacteria bacterium]|nr:hypothetical protein [Candidatus Daviesbacteria bacterium]
MINIIVSSDPRYFVNKDAIRLAVLDALRRYRISGRVELGVSIVGDRKMHLFLQIQDILSIKMPSDWLSLMLCADIGFPAE